MQKERDISLIIGSLLVVFLFGIYGSIGIKEAIAPVKEQNDTVLDLIQAPMEEVTEPVLEDVKPTISYATPTRKPVVLQEKDEKPAMNCAFGGCFEENLRTCTQDTKVLIDQGVMMRFDILFPTFSGCTVKITYTQHPNTAWKGSDLQCVLPKETSLFSAIDESLRLAKAGSALCDGSMVALLKQD